MTVAPDGLVAATVTFAGTPANARSVSGAVTVGSTGVVAVADCVAPLGVVESGKVVVFEPAAVVVGAVSEVEVVAVVSEVEVGAVVSDVTAVVVPAPLLPTAAAATPAPMRPNVTRTAASNLE